MYKLSKKNYELLRSIDFSEMGDSVSFDDDELSFDTDNIRLLLVIINEEIATNGMTDDQQEATEYGRKLYALYDAILMQKE